MCMCGYVGVWVYTQTDRWMDGWTDSQTRGKVDPHIQTDRTIDGWIDTQIHRHRDIDRQRARARARSREREREVRRVEQPTQIKGVQVTKSKSS